jgi:hypothetical protein
LARQRRIAFYWKSHSDFVKREYNISMARRKREDYQVRSLHHVSGGKGYAITLPVEVIRAFRWQKKQKLQLKIDDKKKTITIEDWPVSAKPSRGKKK